jgi:hypothetical protein
MNPRQQAFFRQAQSDWFIFRLFRENLVAQCHELHYLQMCTEKLAKAYYQTVPSRDGHAAFRRFLTDLPGNPAAVAPLGFADVAALTRWQGSVSPIVGALEDLAPSIADRKNLPNPEYPWPRNAPLMAPVDYSFDMEVYAHLDNQAASGEPRFLMVLKRMIESMQAGHWYL